MNPDADISEVEFCAFDLETTGISPFSEIVEIGGVLFRLGEEGTTFSTLVEPARPIPPQVTAIHGITDEMVAGAPNVVEALDSFFDFAGNSVLLAHNASFDVGILQTELTRSRLPFPPNRVLDTLRIAQHFIPQAPNHKLGTLVEYLGSGTEGLHRALQDAIAVRQVFEYVINKPGQWISCLYDLMGASRVYSIEARVEADVELPAEFGCIAEAMKTQSVLTLIYDGGTKGNAPRRLTPILLFERYGVAYMEAYCHEDKMRKSYRIDRIVEIIESE